MENETHAQSEEDELLQKFSELLISGKDSDLDKLLSSDSYTDSENAAYYKKVRKNIGALNYPGAYEMYGSEGISRFYNTLVDGHKRIELGDGHRALKKKLDRIIGEDKGEDEYYNVYGREEPSRSRLSKALGWVIFPVKLMSKVYDFVLNKTGSHLASWGASIAAMYESLTLGLTAASAAYYSITLGAPFLGMFGYFLKSSLSQLLYVGAGMGAMGMGLTYGMVTAERKKFSVKKLTIEETKQDIKNYSVKFKRVWKAYASRFLANKNIKPNLDMLNAMYNMSTTEESINDRKEEADKLKRTERSYLPYIEKVLGKRTGKHGISHRCFSGVGGVTLVPLSLLGKLFRKRIAGKPVFLNTERATAYPSYQFALFHELAHAAGATTEPMANYYAMGAMDEVAKDKPFLGYDLYSSVNKLMFAVGALKEKLEDSPFINSLKKLNVPKFVYEALTSNFNPDSSPLPPTYELFGESVESNFGALYVSSSHVARKLVEGGSMRLFKYSSLNQE